MSASSSGEARELLPLEKGFTPLSSPGAGHNAVLLSWEEMGGGGGGGVRTV